MGMFREQNRRKIESFGLAQYRKHFWGVLVVVLCCIHIYSLIVFGATFWYDSIIYIDLSSVLFDHSAMIEYYSGLRYFVFQHIMPGLPLLWAVARAIGGHDAWLILALLQHALSIAGLTYFCWALRPLIPKLLILFGAILVSLHPFYMAFHSSVMTESISGSATLIMLGATISVLLSRHSLRTAIVLIAATAILAGLFRSYNAIIAFTMLVLIVIRLRSWRAGVIAFISAGIIATSYLGLPIYRWSETGRFFLPSVNYLSLTHALWATPVLTPQTLEHLADLPLPRGMDLASLQDRRLSYRDSAEIGNNLLNEGILDADAKNILFNHALTVRFQSVDGILNQLILSLASIGLTNIPFFVFDTDELVYFGYSAAALHRHVESHRRYCAWTLYDSHQPILVQFLARYRNEPEFYNVLAIAEMQQAITPYISTFSSSNRDPLNLMSVPNDVWTLGLILGAVLLVTERRILVGLSMLSLVGLTYAVNFSIPLYDPRSSYALLAPGIILTTVSPYWLFDCIRCRIRQAIGRQLAGRQAGGSADSRIRNIT